MVNKWAPVPMEISGGCEYLRQPARFSKECGDRACELGLKVRRVRRCARTLVECTSDSKGEGDQRVRAFGSLRELFYKRAPGVQVESGDENQEGDGTSGYKGQGGLG